MMSLDGRLGVLPRLTAAFMIRCRPARNLRLLSLAALLTVTIVACGIQPSRIAFTSDRDGNLEIYAVDQDGGNETNLTNSTGDEFSPVMSPDGEFIAFQSGSGDDIAIEVMMADGTGRESLTTGPGIHRSHRWSPDGKRVAYVVDRNGGHITYVAMADGSAPALLTSTIFDEVGDWAEDGSSVVFAVRSGEERGIWVRNPYGVNEFHITDTPDRSPVWSPDSSKIAFISTRDGNSEIYVMNADGTQPSRLTETDSSEYEVSWSPNGKRLLFVSERDGNPEIYVSTVDGVTQTRLTFNNARDDQPAWSPDGGKIAFVSYLDGDGEIFVMDADGENQTRLTSNEAKEDHPSW